MASDGSWVARLGQGAELAEAYRRLARRARAAVIFNFYESH